QANDYLGYKLAEIMGLLTPRTEMVNVTINGKKKGLFTYVEQLDELTLRRHRKMPGDLYVGEIYLKDEYIGAGQNLFLHPSLWDKASVNNHYPEESYEPLKRLTELCSILTQTEESSRQLSQLLDMDAWGKFSAFETLAQTPHYDTIHNWRLYFDPARGVFLPVVWDPVGWPDWPRAANSEEEMHLEISPSRLHFALFQNGDFLRARQQALQDFFLSATDQEFLQEVERTLTAIKHDIRQDPNVLLPDQTFNISKLPQIPEDKKKTRKKQKQLPFVPKRAGNLSEVFHEIEALEEKIHHVFSSIRAQYIDDKPVVRYSPLGRESKLALQVTGRQSPDALTFRFRSPIKAIDSATLHYWKGTEKFSVDVLASTQVRGDSIELSIPLLPEVRATTQSDSPKIDVLAAYYEIDFGDALLGNRLIEVSASYREDIAPAIATSQIPPSAFHTLNNIVPHQVIPTTLIWENDLVIEGVQTIKTNVIIRKGTQVRLKPGAVLILEGQLHAQGTKNEPIRFLPFEEGQTPWGAIVLKGPEASGSRLFNCEFKGGSGLKEPLREYSAMFSIHDAENIHIEKCRFSDSTITDDMVHAVYAKVYFKSCTFSRSAADALDLDVSQGIVEGCTFSDSGNDALDLMTSNITVLDTTLQNSGDKGISVGEGSNLLVINSRFLRNNIGLQSKDRSLALLYNVDFANNHKALDAYKKNWRYDDGGSIFVYNARLSKNAEMASADKKSSISIFDSELDQQIAIESKNVFLSQSETNAESGSASRNKLEQHAFDDTAMKNFSMTTWNRINTAQRGASLGQY
ncbi:MAG: CotH kinase family protein, partial [Desulfuromonadales bacterium]|nr:CotH kinase family protein [Desulfuromonadales bacterium]